MEKLYMGQPISDPLKAELIQKGRVPLSKTWAARNLYLDVVEGTDRGCRELESYPDLLNGDICSMCRATRDILEGKKVIDFGETATYYRFHRLRAWALGLDLEFAMHGTLKRRFEEGHICNDPAIVGLSQRQLRQIDNKTTQWASAKALLGDAARLRNAPRKLKETYEAIDMRKKGMLWVPCYDETILGQEIAYLQIYHRGKTGFEPKHSEDAVFGLMFGMLSEADAARRWPQLVGHESNRIEEVRREREAIHRRGPVTSKDHRVVMAGAELQLKLYGKINAEDPSAVDKSCPQFWGYLEDVPGIIRYL